MVALGGCCAMYFCHTRRKRAHKAGLDQSSEVGKSFDNPIVRMSKEEEGHDSFDQDLRGRGATVTTVAVEMVGRDRRPSHEPTRADARALSVVVNRDTTALSTASNPHASNRSASGRMRAPTMDTV